MRNKFHLLLVGLCLPLLGACADMGYYLHSVKGHFSIIQQKRDIDDILRDEHVDSKLSQRLQLVQGIRRFAFDELMLPESDSYSEYADLKRNYVLKNLFAAEEFSIRAKQWCYPIVGCAGYRGFFDLERLDEFVSDLQQQNYDVYVASVAAYSTLGWFDDPVLNTFINWPDYRLAGLIFHELAHQQLYVDGDSRFNESFATAVQQAGVEKWLLSQGLDLQLQLYRQHILNRRAVFDLIKQTRNELDQLYQRDINDDEKRRLKAQALERLKARYQALAKTHQVKDGFQRWFDGELNNARLVSVSTYNDWVPVFSAILVQQQGDFRAFYNEVERISKVPRQQRQQCFDDWLQHPQTALHKSFCE